jgi:hypothetical protein
MFSKDGPWKAWKVAQNYAKVNNKVTTRSDPVKNAVIMIRPPHKKNNTKK